MPTFKRGDLFRNLDKYDLVFVTTNGTLNTKGELLMGAGIAAQAKNLYPSLPKSFGDKIKPILDLKPNGWYGICILPNSKIAAFQTKVNPYNDSDPRLIRFSTECLIDYASNNIDLNIALNYPGIGLGQLDKSVVEPIIRLLPDNVTIWEL
jgi:hypothetical protein